MSSNFRDTTAPDYIPFASITLYEFSPLIVFTTYSLGSKCTDTSGHNSTNDEIIPPFFLDLRHHYC